MVNHEDLTELARDARVELNKCVVSSSCGNIWDGMGAASSIFRDAVFLLTPPYKSGDRLKGVSLAAGDKKKLESSVLTKNTGLQGRLSRTWAGLRNRAFEAGRIQKEREHERGASPPPSKRFCRSGIDGRAASDSTYVAADGDGYDLFGESEFGGNFQGKDSVRTAACEEEKQFKMLMMERGQVSGRKLRR